MPLNRLLTEVQERQRFLSGTFHRWKADERNQDANEQQLADAFDRIGSLVERVGPAELKEPYAGTRRQRAAIHTLTSLLINRVLNAIHLREPTPENPTRVSVDPTCKDEITILKELTWHYVIRNPSLAALEFGQRKVIRDLFEMFSGEAARGRRTIFPHRYRERLESIDADFSGQERAQHHLRIVVDVIAEMTEHRAYELHKTLTGYSPVSILDHAGR